MMLFLIGNCSMARCLLEIAIQKIVEAAAVSLSSLLYSRAVE